MLGSALAATSKDRPQLAATAIPLTARISVLREHKNPRQRIEFEVFVE